MDKRSNAYLRMIVILLVVMPVGVAFWISLFEGTPVTEIVADQFFWILIGFQFMLLMPGFWFMERRGHLSERWY